MPVSRSSMANRHAITILKKALNRNSRFETAFRLAFTLNGLLSQGFSPVCSPRCFLLRRKASVKRPRRCEPPEMPFLRSIPQTRCPSRDLVTIICAAPRATYPAGDGSVTILRSMPPKSCRVCDDSPPAATSSSGNALPTGRRFSPAAGLQAGQRPVADHLGRASRRQMLPRL